MAGLEGVHCIPLKRGHSSNQDTLTGPEGGRIRGSPLCVVIILFFFRLHPSLWPLPLTSTLLRVLPCGWPWRGHTSWPTPPWPCRSAAPGCRARRGGRKVRSTHLDPCNEATPSNQDTRYVERAASNLDPCNEAIPSNQDTRYVERAASNLDPCNEATPLIRTQGMWRELLLIWIPEMRPSLY